MANSGYGWLRDNEDTLTEKERRQMEEDIEEGLDRGREERDKDHSSFYF